MNFFASKSYITNCNCDVKQFKLDAAASQLAFIFFVTFATFTEGGREAAASLITPFILLIMYQSAVEVEQILNCNVKIFITLESYARIDSFVLNVCEYVNECTKVTVLVIDTRTSRVRRKHQSFVSKYIFFLQIYICMHLVSFSSCFPFSFFSLIIVSM